jgi:Tfp pilus assembly protein PilW
VSRIRRFLRNAEGLTLVETMIVIAVSSIVLAAIAAAMAAGARSWQSTSSAAAMSRQADAALASIISKIRIACKVDLSTPGSPEVVVVRTAGEYKYSFTLTEGNIIMQITNPDATTSSSVIGSDVTLMEITEVGTDSYEITVRCEDSEASKTASTRVTIRQ